MGSGTSAPAPATGGHRSRSLAVSGTVRNETGAGHLRFAPTARPQPLLSDRMNATASGALPGVGNEYMMGSLEGIGMSSMGFGRPNEEDSTVNVHCRK